MCIYGALGFNLTRTAPRCPSPTSLSCHYTISMKLREPLDAFDDNNEGNAVSPSDTRALRHLSQSRTAQSGAEPPIGRVSSGFHTNSFLCMNCFNFQLITSTNHDSLPTEI